MAESREKTSKSRLVWNWVRHELIPGMTSYFGEFANTWDFCKPRSNSQLAGKAVVAVDSVVAALWYAQATVPRLKTILSLAFLGAKIPRFHASGSEIAGTQCKVRRGNLIFCKVKFLETLDASLHCPTKRHNGALSSTLFAVMRIRGNYMTSGQSKP